MLLKPASATSFPSGSVSLNVVDDNDVEVNLSQYTNITAIVYIAGRDPQLALITENNRIVFTMPDIKGVYNASILLESEEISENLSLTVRVRDIGAAPFEIALSPVGGTEPYRADVYDPRGTMVGSFPLEQYYAGYLLRGRPDPDWLPGTYQAIIWDADDKEQDVTHFYVDKPGYASAPTFWSYPEKIRLLLEYLKYDLMGDTEPMPPTALQTIEQYAKHWAATVWDMNNTMPFTNYGPAGCPSQWYYTVLQGTTLQVLEALSNRSVTIPRFTGVPTLIQDESHLAQSWQARYDNLKPDYDKQKVRTKARHLPQPGLTVDPFLGWIGGSLAGTSLTSLLGRPSWFTRAWTGR